MAFPSKFYKLTLNWDLPGGERASCTSHWVSDVDDFSADNTRLALRGDAFWDDMKGSYNSNTKYVGTRVDYYGTDGLLISTADNGVTPVDGTQSSNNLPTEVAVVVSERTALSGRRHRGRFYLPAPTLLNVSATGRVAAGTTAAFADRAQDFLAPFTTPDMVAVLCSRADESLDPLTELRVGDVFDVQRRRRQDLVEVNEVRSIP